MPNLNSQGETPEPKMHAWRLETFDLRAGLAFATYREAQRPDEQETHDMADWPCYFFSPPDFDPQPVDNVALALAASRGSFDSALIVGKEETGCRGQAISDTPIGWNVRQCVLLRGAAHVRQASGSPVSNAA